MKMPSEFLYSSYAFLYSLARSASMASFTMPIAR